MKTRICSKCKQNKVLKNFYKRSIRKSRSKQNKPYKKRRNNTGLGDYHNLCKKCTKQRNHKYYLNNKEKFYEQTKKWRQSHREERRARANQERLRLLTFFGGKCCKCGFSDARALQIDHINGDGYKDKRSYKSQVYNLLKLIKLEPDLIRIKYQLLCANCNWIKRAENHEY